MWKGGARRVGGDSCWMQGCIFITEHLNLYIMSFISQNLHLEAQINKSVFYIFQPYVVYFHES